MINEELAQAADEIRGWMAVWACPPHAWMISRQMIAVPVLLQIEMIWLQVETEFVNLLTAITAKCLSV